MKTKLHLFTTLALLTTFAHLAGATQADDTTVVIKSQAAGPTPFISRLTLAVSNLSVLQRVQFAVAPKPGSVTRPLSATYTQAYLAGRGDVNPAAGEMVVPVFGLYDAFNNGVTLTYYFADGSSRQASTGVTTAAFDDACDFNTPEVLQARTAATDLSFDFMLVGAQCGTHSPTVLDTDGAVRWVGPGGVQNKTCQPFDSVIYQADGSRLLRMELDGEVKVMADYSDRGVRGFHHNIDTGKNGLLMGVTTDAYAQSIILGVNGAGEVLKEWNFAEIIRQAMVAGGDDPSTFIQPHSESWFHNNSATYRKADNSLVVSSRENFVICVDYDTSAIKWILGDTRKKWYQYPSLRKYALTLAPGGIAPSGQHAVSMGKDGTVLLMDNGTPSLSHSPAGPTRHYAAARKYKLNLPGSAAEVWNFTNNQSVYAPYCSSVYEDAPNNYLVDYAPGFKGRARLLALNAAGEKIFEYAYPTGKCEDAYRSVPLHWEKLKFGFQ